MRNAVIFVITVVLAWVCSAQINSMLEKRSYGASLETFKKLRINGIRDFGPQPTKKYDVLVLGDSLMEILFDPVDFDELAAQQGQMTESWNLALRSLMARDFETIVNSLLDRGDFDSCLVQIPALHFQRPSRFYRVDKIWPGYGLPSALNLWNPLSRLNHGLNSPANLWTGPVTHHSDPWNQSLRGGLRVQSIEGYEELHKLLQSPLIRRQLNESYNQIMGLSTYHFDQDSVDVFIKQIHKLAKICVKTTLVWPLFSPELRDRSLGPDPGELSRLRLYLEKATGQTVINMPWNEDEIIFLDSQHIDPQERGVLHAWLLQVI